jgi:ribose transport system substrate-binding protein
MDASSYTRRSLLAAGAAGGLVLAGCGSSKDDSSSASGGAATASPSDSASLPAALKPLKAELDSALGVPKFVPPGPAFDISSAKGKSLRYIAITLGVPVLQQNWAGVQQAAKAAGLDATSFDGKGSTSLSATGIESAINDGIDVILLDAIPPNTIAAPVQKALKKGIKVIFVDALDPASERKWYPAGAPPDTGSGTVSFDFVKAAQLEADWVLVDSGGKNINCVTFGVPGDPASQTMVAVIADRFKQYAQGPYKLKHQWAISPDWATREPIQTRSVMNADKAINYIIPVVDAQSLYIVPALQQIGREDVKLVAFNGTPAVMQYVQRKQLVRMDIATGFTWEGWQDVDQALRALTGNPPAPRNTPPLRAFTWDNIASIDPKGDNADWFNSDSTAIPGFKSLWGLS